jgi:hypothetical protein
MPAKVNMLTEAQAFKLEGLSEFVPKLAQQSIMVHFCTVSSLSIPLQEQSSTISQQAFPCINSHYFSMLHPMEHALFKNHIRCGVIWRQFCSLKFLPSNANPYSSARVLRPG